MEVITAVMAEKAGEAAVGLVVSAIKKVYGAASGAKQNPKKSRRWAARVRSCEASVLRAASSASLTKAQSGAVRRLGELFLDSATFIRQFNQKGNIRRFFSHESDADAFTEFGKQLDALLLQLSIDLLSLIHISEPTRPY